MSFLPPVPPLKSAFEHPPTLRAHKRLVVKRVLWLVFTVALAAAAITYSIEHSSIGLAVLSTVFFGPVLPTVVIALLRTRRNRRILSSYPWRAHACSYPRRPRDSPVVITVHFGDQHRPVWRITPFSVDLAHKRNAHPGMIWFAGDPAIGGVVSPAGGHFPVRVVPDRRLDSLPRGTPEAHALAERAGLVKNGRVLGT
jgi:hypothetical protein